MNFFSWLRHAVRSAWFWITIWVVLVVGGASVISIMYWDWLSVRESNGSTIRNIVLAVAALLALPLAIWRSTVADRQAKTAQRQSETVQRGLLNERYQKGAEMLGSTVLPVRLGGIYALARLAREHPGDYHTQIMSLLCAFVRNPPGVGKEKQDPKKLREDVQAVMTAVGERSKSQTKIEEKEEYRINLPEVDLHEANLRGANLTRADLWKANLRGADLHEADLTKANLRVADLAGVNLEAADLTRAMLNSAKLNEHADLTRAVMTGARLRRADLHEADLAGADLGEADLRDCKGLTQEELDQAFAREDIPPKLEGVVDAETGKPLVWRGRFITE